MDKPLEQFPRTARFTALQHGKICGLLGLLVHVPVISK
jgi:hypothetical protein